MPQLTPSPHSARQEFSILWSLAWPIVLGFLGHMGTSVVDTIMVGQLGKESLAAVALAGMWCHSLVLLGIGVVQGLDPIVSQAHGAGDRKRVSQALVEGLLVALLVSIPLIGWHFLAAHGLTLLQQPTARIPEAAEFAKVLSIGMVPLMLFVCLRQCAQGIGLMRPAAYSYVIINILNVGLNMGLMYGKWGLPKLGTIGCAWSTAICQFLQLFIMLWLIRKPFHQYWLSPLQAWTRAGIQRILRLGLSIGSQVGLEVWAFVTAGLLIGLIGETELAAHTIALNLASASFMMAMGVSQAATTRVGNLIGAQQSWHQAAFCALLLGTGFMSLSALAFAVLPETLARIYSSDPDVIAFAAGLIPIAAAFQIFDAIQNVSYGVLRGAGDVKVPMTFAAIGLWCCGLPAGALLAFGAGLQSQGVWIGLVIGLGVMSVLLLRRIRLLMRTPEHLTAV